MLQMVFGGMLGASMLYSLIRGNGKDVMAAVLGAAQEGVEMALSLAGGFALFCGLLGILKEAGITKWLGLKMTKPLRLLMGRQVPEDAMEYVTLNLAANMLGLGNAATPMGIEAARRMAARGEAAGNALCMFLVINSSSVQLLPTSVIALRAAAGSSDPGAVILPAFLATLVSTVTGIVCCKIVEKR